MCIFCTERFRVIASPEESKQLTASKMPAIVISSSGMAEGGRVLHHLKAALPDSRNTVLFAGYQGVGTRGWRLVNGEKTGQDPRRVDSRRGARSSESIRCRPMPTRTRSCAGCSGFTAPPKRTFIVHGEPAAQDALARASSAELGWDDARAGASRDGAVLRYDRADATDASPASMAAVARIAVGSASVDGRSGPAPRSPLVETVGRHRIHPARSAELRAARRRSRRQLAYWLTQASIAIDPIIYDQLSRYGLREKRLLEGIMAHPAGVAGRDAAARIREYALLFWANRGNHNETTAQKFLPSFTADELQDCRAEGAGRWRVRGRRTGTCRRSDRRRAVKKELADLRPARSSTRRSSR